MLNSWSFQGRFRFRIFQGMPYVKGYRNNLGVTTGFQSILRGILEDFRGSKSLDGVSGSLGAFRELPEAFHGSSWCFKRFLGIV